MKSCRLIVHRSSKPCASVLPNRQLMVFKALKNFTAFFQAVRVQGPGKLFSNLTMIVLLQIQPFPFQLVYSN